MSLQASDWVAWAEYKTVLMQFSTQPFYVSISLIGSSDFLALLMFHRVLLFSHITYIPAYILLSHDTSI